MSDQFLSKIDKNEAIKKLEEDKKYATFRERKTIDSLIDLLKRDKIECFRDHRGEIVYRAVGVYKQTKLLEEK